MDVQIPYFFKFIQLAIISAIFPQFCRCSVVTMSETRDGVVSLGDRMLSHYEFALEQPYNEVMEYAYTADGITEQQLAEFDFAFVKGRSLVPKWERATKVQHVQGKNNKQFVVGLVGYGNMINNFQGADKSGVKSIKSLAKLLDSVHRESELQRASVVGDEVASMESAPTTFLANDGKRIYGIETGRSWGPREKGIRGALKAWWQGRGNAAEGDARGPKIRRLKGNVHAIGFFSDKIEEDLGGKNGPFRGQKRFFGRFGRRMPVKMSVEEAHRLHNDAFAAHSRYLTSPNAVSESNSGFFLGKERRTYQRPRLQPLEHTNPLEEMAIGGTPFRTGEEIVGDLMRKGWWNDRWTQNAENPEFHAEINEWAGNARKKLVAEEMMKNGGESMRRRGSINAKGLRSSVRGTMGIPGVPNQMSTKMLRMKKWRGK